MTRAVDTTSVRQPAHRWSRPTAWTLCRRIRVRLPPERRQTRDPQRPTLSSPGARAQPTWLQCALLLSAAS